MGKNKKKYCLLLTTVKRKQEARTLAQGLLKAKMAACVNITGPVESHYVWKSRLCVDKEHILLVKTERGRFTDVKNYVREHHSYEVPEFIEIGILRGDEKYLDWVSEAVHG